MPSPAKVIAALLKATPGFATGWSVFYSNEPDTPDNCVTVFDTGADREDRQMDGTEVVHPTVQVRVRASDYDTGWAKGEAVQTVMQAVRNTAVAVGAGSVTVKAAHRYIPLTFLGRDPNQNRRQLFVVNFKLTL